jgi:hypothetical protein
VYESRPRVLITSTSATSPKAIAPVRTWREQAGQEATAEGTQRLGPTPEAEQGAVPARGHEVGDEAVADRGNTAEADRCEE